MLYFRPDGRCIMRDVVEYQAKAAEFDALAESASDEALKKRYADLADCCRLCQEGLSAGLEGAEALHPVMPQPRY